MQGTLLARKNRTLLAAVVAVTALSGARDARAASLYWDGTATAWDTASGWSTDPTGNTPDPAAPPGITDVAVFNKNGLDTPQTAVLNADQAAQGISVVGAGKVTINSNVRNNSVTLQLGAAGLNTGPGAEGLNIGGGVSIGTSLMADQSWLSNGTAAGSGIVVLRMVAAGGAGARTLTLGGSSANVQNTIEGIVTDGPSATLGITVNPSNPAAVWTLAVPVSASSTFSGPVVVQNGSLVALIERGLGSGAQGNFPLGSAVSGTTVARGATLSGNQFFAEPLSLAGTGVGAKGALFNGSTSGAIFVDLSAGDTSIGGTGDLNGTITLGGVAGKLRFTGDPVPNANRQVISDIVGSADVVSTAASLRFLGASKTYTGGTFIDGGTFTLGTGLPNTSVFRVATGATFTPGLAGGDASSINPVITATIYGTLSPGGRDDAGILLTGDLFLGATPSPTPSPATFEYSVLPINATRKDLVVVAGKLTIDPANNTILALPGLGGPATVGDLYRLITYSGTWNGGLFTYNGTVIPDDGMIFGPSNSRYLLDYNNATGDANEPFAITLTVLTPGPPTPEPTAGLLLMLGAGALLRRRRR